MPSSSDEETEKLISKQTQVHTTQQPINLRERTKFTERIKVDSKPKPVKPYEVHRAEVYARQTSVPRGMKMEIALPALKPQPLYKESRALTLKRQVEERIHNKMTLQQTLQAPDTLGQRRFSETLSIDHTSKKLMPQFEVCFDTLKKMPPIRIEKSAIQVQQTAALKGYKMEVEIAQKHEKSSKSFIQKQKAQGIETKRQEFQMQLEGMAPRFIIEPSSRKVMDGDEMKFVAMVIGNPMPKIVWYKNGIPVEENPDFRTYYNQKSGECMLHIIEVFPQDTGEYICDATNVYGRASTRAELVVDVYEYIPDSEEASASQTESMLSCDSYGGRREISEDEAEFLERTQKFITNMQKMREEIEEEVQEETTLLVEEYNEETVQMADVKWQIQKHAITTEVDTKTETAGVVAAFTTDMVAETEDSVQMSEVDTVCKPINMIQAIEDKPHVEMTEELISEGSENTQQDQIKPGERKTVFMLNSINKLRTSIFFIELCFL